MKEFTTWKCHWITCSLVVFITLATSAQTPFNRGVNLTNWFQSSTAHEIQFSKYTKKDFQNIKSLGCDVIRLPINLHAMTNGAPDYILDNLFLEFLDHAVDWAEELQMHLILDNHSFDPAVPTDLAISSVLTKTWTQMAHHFKDRSNYIHYEVLNEPHGIADATWGAMQQLAIDAIRLEDTKHFIIVGGVEWNSYNNLKNLPLYTDNKLIYTFHFYDPFIFTHQGASWENPSLAPLAGVPFPYRSNAMPTVPASLTGTWVEGAMNNYVNTGTLNKIKELIDIAVDFKNQRNVAVYCGEFGVYTPNSNNSDRVSWYQAVRNYFVEKGISYTTWDYQGEFGLFTKNSNELFDNDLNVPLLQALALIVPEQKAYEKKPRTTGFTLYDDYVGEGIVTTSSSGTGTLDYYSTTSPKAENYCIYWTGVGRYDQIGFDFRPDIDLSMLKGQDTLDFWVRGNVSSAKFDMRFIDTKTGTVDHPWRMGKTIDNTFAPWDNTWHHIQIPLTKLEDKGSYDNAWFPPPGKFDWSSVDRFEIVPEAQPLDGIQFSFDNIKISGKDIIISGLENPDKDLDLKIYPNPFAHYAIIEYQLPTAGILNVTIYSALGEKIKTLLNDSKLAGNHVLHWDGKNDADQYVAEGLYVVRLITQHTSKVGKVIFGSVDLK
jgi:endoglucanase